MVSTKPQDPNVSHQDPATLKKAIKSTSSTQNVTQLKQKQQSKLKNVTESPTQSNNKNIIGDEVAPAPPGANEGVVVRSISSDSDIDSKPLLQRINWLHFYLIVGLPIIVLTASFFVPIRFATVILGVITYNAFGMGITMGYHRLLSHRSYDASPIVHFVLLLLGAGAFQGSARWWSRNHRAHHRYVDTDKDPYNAKRGVFYSHVGWMLVKQNPNSIGRVDISDLDSPLLKWQHDNYLLISGFMSFLLPTIIAWVFWNDPLGGFFYAGIARLIALHHATFCINSLAHLVGSQSFSEDHTAADSYITALVTFGEGYHNWHHTFASDYRNGIRWYHWDPAKWLINVLSWFGLAYNINAFPENLIQKTILQLQEHKVHEKLAIVEKELIAEKVAKGFKYPLEEITLTEMKKRVEKNGEKLIAVDGKVLNVEKWGAIHPGGTVIINTYIGKDASSAFNGVVHPHSNTAHNVLESLAVAILKRE